MRIRKEIRSLTGLRGIAALYVVCFHFLEGPSSNQLLAHGYLAVDLFFVLSGFVMALNYQSMFSEKWSISSYLTFLGRRIARIYPLFLVCTATAFLLIVCGVLAECHTPRTIVLNVLMMQNWGFGCGSLDIPGWSISTEWAAYLLFPLLLIPTLHRKSTLPCSALLFSVLTIAGLCWLPQSMRLGQNPARLLDYTNPYYGLAVVRCVSEFTLGLLCYRAAESGQCRSNRAHNWVAPVTSLAILTLLATPKSDFFVVLLFPILILGLALGDDPVNRILSSGPLEFLGVLSYSVYLTHGLLLGSFGYWIQVKVVSHGLNHPHALSVILKLALVFPTAILAHHFIEVPSRRWLRRCFEPNAEVIIRDDRISVSPS